LPRGELFIDAQSMIADELDIETGLDSRDASGLPSFPDPRS